MGNDINVFLFPVILIPVRPLRRVGFQVDDHLTLEDAGGFLCQPLLYQFVGFDGYVDADPAAA